VARHRRGRRIAAQVGNAKQIILATGTMDLVSATGCTDQEILDHCRRPVEHSTHCWVVDLVLGNV
jgi:hypothetical protein